jgi:hypothetical protein
MNKQRLSKIHDILTEKERQLLRLKREGYGSDEQVLQNFIEAGKLLDIRPSEVAFLYFTKHLISIKKAVVENSYSLTWEKSKADGSRDEGLIQRIADARNYLFFVVACLEYEGEQVADFNLKREVE